MSDASDSRPPPSTVEYHHVKSTAFRVIHVDGGVGGLTPRGYCHIAVYNERQAIPRMTTRPISPEGSVGAETVVESRGEPNIGVVREIEADLIFDLPTAVELHEWLGKRITELKTIKDEIDSGPRLR